MWLVVELNPLVCRLTIPSIDAITLWLAAAKFIHSFSWRTCLASNDDGMMLR